MGNIQDNIRYLKNIVEKREKYIHFSILGTAIWGIIFCIFPFISEQLADFLNIQLTSLFGLFAVITFLIVTVLSLFEAKSQSRELFPKSIRYVLGNLCFAGGVFFIAQILIWEFMFDLFLFYSILVYGGLIWVSRMFLPKTIVWYGWGLLIYAGILFFLSELSTKNIIQMPFAVIPLQITFIFIPFWIWHLLAALGLFLEKSNTTK